MGGGGGTPLCGLYGDFVVNFLSEVMFDFSFVLGMVMYANIVETEEKKIT